MQEPDTRYEALGPFCLPELLFTGSKPSLLLELSLCILLRHSRSADHHLSSFL